MKKSRAPSMADSRRDGEAEEVRRRKFKARTRKNQHKHSSSSSSHPPGRFGAERWCEELLMGSASLPLQRLAKIIPFSLSLTFFLPLLPLLFPLSPPLLPLLRDLLGLSLRLQGLNSIGLDGTKGRHRAHVRRHRSMRFGEGLLPLHSFSWRRERAEWAATSRAADTVIIFDSDWNSQQNRLSAARWFAEKRKVREKKKREEEGATSGDGSRLCLQRGGRNVRALTTLCSLFCCVTLLLFPIFSSPVLFPLDLPFAKEGKRSAANGSGERRKRRRTEEKRGGDGG